MFLIGKRVGRDLEHFLMEKKTKSNQNSSLILVLLNIKISNDSELEILMITGINSVQLSLERQYHKHSIKY